MRHNHGSLPGEARGKRVRVKLRNDRTFEAPADGKGAPDWRITGSPFDIVEWEVV